jgi:hypothetical protein
MEFIKKSVQTAWKILVCFEDKLRDEHLHLALALNERNPTKKAY